MANQIRNGLAPQGVIKPAQQVARAQYTPNLTALPSVKPSLPTFNDMKAKLPKLPSVFNIFHGPNRSK